MDAQLHAFNKELEVLKGRLERETESYRGRLRKSEFLFQREYTAASALVELIASIEPTYRSPWMDRDALCAALESEMDAIEQKIGAFTGKHGAILPAEVRALIVKAQNLAGQGKFGQVEGNESPRALAGNCYDALADAERMLVAHVHRQSEG